MRIYLTVFFAFVFSTMLLAQPEPHIGCHHFSKKDIPVPGFQLAPSGIADTRSDSIDILNYKIDIDITVPGFLSANTVVSASALVDNIDEIVLDLLMLQVDSVFVDGVPTTFIYDDFKCSIALPEIMMTGDDFDVHVYYQGNPVRDPSNFGGLVFEQGYIYNLGIGIASNPHNFGRGWFPCFDNFMERSTYEYIVTHSSAYNAHCVGTEIDITNNGDGSITTTYAMDQPITTYQSSIAASNYVELWSEHEGMDGTIPVKLICKPGDSTAMKSSFGNLGGTIDCMESWYGPYVWERVGYVATTVGAMEHPTNIAYPISSINGNANSNTRLVSHEFAHNWFGNMITLTTSMDMWIKEGPAEYGWHQTAECIYGYEEFLEVVKDNHLYVLERAHVDDEGFRALSGMPNEFTYGTHTYRKGASVIHNLRGYLGDELFATGMKSILENYLYSHLDAEEFRDEITMSTGFDATDFFDAWIFNPGFSVFVDDSISSVKDGNLWNNKVFVQQKLRGTDFYHKNVPIQLQAIGFGGETSEQDVIVSDQYSTVDFVTDFEVKRIVFNGSNKLNQARMAEDVLIEDSGNAVFARTGVRFSVDELEEPFLARVEHIWASPDQAIIAGDFEISDQHYWRVAGDIPSDNTIELRLPYVGGSIYDLDNGLTEEEDSVLLFYRPDASALWEPLPEAKKTKIIPNDGNGLLTLDFLMPGEYTIGKGDVSTVDVDSWSDRDVQIYPNPSSNGFYVYLDENSLGDVSIRLLNVQGNPVVNSTFERSTSYTYLPTNNLVPGPYFVELINQKTGEKIVKMITVIQ